MTTKEFIALEKSLLPEMPNFTIKGPLMFIAPVRHVLLGVNFEGSSFNKESFYVTAFVLPLYVPTEHLYFNFGHRIRHEPGGDRWNADAPNLLAELSIAMKREALPFLSRVESLKDFVEVAKSFSLENPHTLEAIAYALACAGDMDKAVAALNELTPRLDVKVSWQLEMAERANVLKSKLLSNPRDAKQQLETWEAESIRNLGLERFR